MSSPTGGRYKPSLTADHFFRVLVVFVRFQGDNEATDTWPDPERLPDWAETILDARVEDIGHHPRNISNYYFENSNGKYRIIGDVFYVTTDSTEDFFHASIPGDDVTIRGSLAAEVLTKLADPSGPHRVDFRKYDHWTYQLDHVTTFEPDSAIDMIWLLTRTYHSMPSSRNTQHRGHWKEFQRTSADFNVEGAPLVFNGVRVHASIGNVDGWGSGLMVIADNNHKPVFLYEPGSSRDGHPTLYGEIIHETSHYLFGTGHFGDANTSFSNRRYSSYFSGLSANSSNCFSHHLGYEKIKLGWLTEGDGMRTVGIDEPDVTVELDDQAAPPGGIKAVKIPVEGSDQFFLLENRGWKGVFEPRYVPYNAGARWAPGILLYHIIQESPYFHATRAQVLCADGRYRWKLVSDQPKLMKRDSADALYGYDEREKIFVEERVDHLLAGSWPEEKDGRVVGSPYPDCTNCRDAETPANDNVGDAYDLFQAGDVITPFSNPAFLFWSGRAFVDSVITRLGVHIQSFDEVRGSFTVRIVRDNLDELPPSRPTGLKGVRDDGCALIQWSPNREPLLKIYRVYRSADGNAFALAGEIAHPATLWRDCAIPRLLESVTYRVQAVDSHDRVSTLSEPVVLIPAK